MLRLERKPPDGLAFLRMVPGMAPNRSNRSPVPGERHDVTDWLAGRGGVVFTIIAVVLVVWAVVTEVVT